VQHLLQRQLCKHLQRPAAPQRLEHVILDQLLKQPIVHLGKKLLALLVIFQPIIDKEGEDINFLVFCKVRRRARLRLSMVRGHKAVVLVAQLGTTLANLSAFAAQLIKWLPIAAIWMRCRCRYRGDGAPLLLLYRCA
jgi:hypothetical protein